MKRIIRVPSNNAPNMAEVGLAKQMLSRYAGNGFRNPNLLGYTGEGDSNLEFQGGNSFLDELTDNAFFQFTLANNDAATRYVYLTPGLLYAPGQTPIQGVLQTGTFDDVNGNVNALSAQSTSGRSIEMLHAFITHNPTRIVRMKVKASTDSQADLQAEIIRQNPFQDEGSIPIRPGKGVDGDTQNDKRFSYDFALQADNQTLIKYAIAPSELLTIDLEVGAIWNNAQALNNKARLAHSNVAREMSRVQYSRYNGR